jgi:outer membrane protein assembly factor BamB
MWSIALPCKRPVAFSQWPKAAVSAFVLLSAGSWQAHAQDQSPCTTEPSAGVSITTYHNDAQRTGWNRQETTLKTCNVNPRSFGLLHSVRLDDQVDAQPLVVANQEIETPEGRRTYEEVVYVATESNTIYAIDSSTGRVLKQRTLGNPVPQSKLPGNCGNNGPNVGIMSTPVIDPAARTMYVIAYLMVDDAPTYRVYALDLSSLNDRTKPPVISGAHELVDGTVLRFVPQVSRQRPALVTANGNIYAGFGSFCDFSADLSRGWLLGWQANSLTPMGFNQLNDRRKETNSLRDTGAKRSFFLSSIWMSGYGVAADTESQGVADLFFVTGNSDRLGPFQIDPKNSLQESVVRMRGDLTEVVDYFTPAGSPFGLQRLDSRDNDFGSGGILLIPGDQPGQVKHLAVAAGKAGQMYLLNRDDLGKYDTGGKNHVLDVVDIGRCWCGQSYFVGADDVGRVVSSGGSNIIVWRLETSPTPKLVKEYVSVELGSSSFQKGFFTWISSRGKMPGSAIIWAIRRPTSANSPNLTLYAFDAENGALLFAAPAGTWPLFQTAAANVVPVVANGKVFVASYQELRIFGLGGASIASSAMTVQAEAKAAAATAAAAKDVGAKVSGAVIESTGSKLWLNTSSGIVQVDATRAQQAGHSVYPEPGQPVVVRGSIGERGVVNAESIYYGSEPK